ncbi:hypothetical protein MEO42_23955 [Dolichospermum sp. ST_sed6]|nr:hypothetical protein [Dolichospermum sp. ST_sed6]MDD1457675.1 hypothetical protein [Dolichospermum sp. ST_sed7]
MLKIRNLIFALSLSPLLSVTWQLPNQAQTDSPSKGTAGGVSGATSTASETSIFSLPTFTVPITPGVSATITDGVSTTGDLTAGSAGNDANTATVTVTAANTESTSPNITVTDGAGGGSIVLTLSPEAQVSVTQLATAIVQGLSNAPGGSAAAISSLLTSGTGSQTAAASLISNLTTAGISPEQAQDLVTALTGLFASPQASLPNLPVAQTTSGQLVASNKILKPISLIAQADAAPSVNVNRLNNAIVTYNGIILQSKPDTLKKLYRDEDFVTISKILQELRRAIP